jgi:hypothetical protein
MTRSPVTGARPGSNYESGGQEFESLRARQKINDLAALALPRAGHHGRSGQNGREGRGQEEKLKRALQALNVAEKQTAAGAATGEDQTEDRELDPPGLVASGPPSDNPEGGRVAQGRPGGRLAPLN